LRPPDPRRRHPHARGPPRGPHPPLALGRVDAPHARSRCSRLSPLWRPAAHRCPPPGSPRPPRLPCSPHRPPRAPPPPPPPPAPARRPPPGPAHPPITPQAARPAHQEGPVAERLPAATPPSLPMITETPTPRKLV